MPISLRKAAYLLGTSQEMLLRWARQGVLPAIERAGTYRFERQVLKAWARRRGMTLKKEAPDQGEGDDPNPISLTRAVEVGGVYFDVGGTDVEAVFQAAVEQVSWPDTVDGQELVECLLERESLASTGIGNGIAIPHPRQPFEHSPENGMICACFLENEIDFQAVDGEPVKVMFLMLNRNTKLHLQLLARLSYCLHQPEFLKMLSTCRNKDEFLSCMSEMESGLGGNGLSNGG